MHPGVFSYRKKKGVYFPYNVQTTFFLAIKHTQHTWSLESYIAHIFTPRMYI